MKSMTGFARRDISLGTYSGTMQLKSYNNRFLDIDISLPPQISTFEPRIKKFLSERVLHGKLEFSVKLINYKKDSALTIDAELAKSTARSFTELAKICGIDEKPSLALISSVDGVVQFAKAADEDSFWPQFEIELKALFDDYEAERVREGKATFFNIEQELGRLISGLETVKSRLPDIENSVKRSLVQKFDELLPKGYDEGRILSEVAVQIVRFSVNEEVSRLSAHIDIFKETSMRDGQAKKLDFICQEMNREVNTIGSKNILIEIAHAVVEMKDAIENIREQIRNVE